MDDSPASTSYKWPNGSCSAALIHYVFLELTGINPDPIEILTYLGITESNGVAATDKIRQIQNDDLGINLDDFIFACGSIFDAFGTSVNFLWIPFNEIPFKLYENAIREHSRQGEIIGCCLDYSNISKSSTAHHHICRCEYKNGLISLIHDDLPSDTVNDTVQLELWEKSVEMVNGGLFVFSTN